MSCCGNKRTEYVGNLSSNNYSNTSASPQKMWDDVYFEYTGQTGLSVTGSITGIRYRFAGNGDVQLVDYRDANGMRAVPVLRKVEEQK